MTSRALPLAGVAAFVFALGGCASTSTESTDGTTSSSSPSSSAATQETASSSRTAAEPKRSEGASTSTAATKAEADSPRSSWRAERDTQREARAASSGGGADSAKLVEQLNEASRELASLRAANAKLRAEKAAPPAPAASTSVAKNDALDDKLAQSMKSYGQFRQEMTTLLADLERLRKENAGLSSNLKSAVEQADQARAAMARLETELRAEKRSHADAERVTAQLRDQLRAIAKALAAAGLSADKLAANAEGGSR